MYMVAVIALVMSMMGMYTTMANQKDLQVSTPNTPIIAGIMNQWHTAATGLATSMMQEIQIPGNGCTLTPVAVYNANDWVPGSSMRTDCRNSSLVPIIIGTTNTSPSVDCSGSTSRPCYVKLPNGYMQPPYAFYTVVYRDASFTPVRDYVLTFVPPFKPKSTNTVVKVNQNTSLCLPGRGPEYFATLADTVLPSCTNTMLTSTNAASGPGSMTVNTSYDRLWKELKGGFLPEEAVGRITETSGVRYFTTETIGFGSTAAPLTYNIPQDIPVGSIGIISQVSFTCTTC